VKEWLKSALNYRSYPKNKTGYPFFFEPPCTSIERNETVILMRDFLCFIALSYCPVTWLERGLVRRSIVSFVVDRYGRKTPSRVERARLTTRWMIHHGALEVLLSQNFSTPTTMWVLAGRLILTVVWSIRLTFRSHTSNSYFSLRLSGHKHRRKTWKSAVGRSYLLWLLLFFSPLVFALFFSFFSTFFTFLVKGLSLIGCLHDPANVQQTFSISTCILNTFVGSLLDVC